MRRTVQGRFGHGSHEVIESMKGRETGSRLAILKLARALGMFRLARRWTGNGLRILCYHGISVADEDEFRPGLFMKPATFRSRLGYLSANGYRVLSLDAALQHLKENSLPRDSVVLTFDDGFFGLHRYGIPILKEFEFPATIYLTTYYAAKETPIFRLLVAYLVWKADKKVIALEGLIPSLSGPLDLRDEQATSTVVDHIIEYGEGECSEGERVEITDRLAGRLGIDYDEMRSQRLMCLVDRAEASDFAKSDIDLQLHTHRHRLPIERQVVKAELSENRRALEDIVDGSVRHFCYPSGIWDRRHWPWLQELGVDSATTCDPGFNYPTTPMLGLKRYLDAEDIPELEFEAELCGFKELLRGRGAGSRRNSDG